ncbi:inter-alpha-trypsin inhibitor heavy chain H4-like isoform X4 [Schistocerca americana]|uniref:inter-alpha-trypsin inhibitor heavy chain H4-like isoform X4 n=1 Tax=Schistocerca americana TaxID=7009 RepID=UPI001F4F6140|nr:inter-alpha-trypsin inhibitor heavy chain H4-like isoform X4 [Schistocerca americana]
MRTWEAVVTAALVAVFALALAAAEDAPEYPPPDVYSLHVVSHVRNRYARTVVTSRVANTANVSREISFDAVLPETAFISGFVIEMDGKAYEAYVKGKEEAREEYQQAVQAGLGAAHVQLSARDSNVVSVSVNVEAQKKVTFNLTYEELLQRELGSYHLRINLNPGQIVNDLSVEVHINETSDITLLEVPSLQQSNDVSDEENSTNPLAHMERPSATTAVVRWSPSREEQAALRAEGVQGQLLVRYDVDHAASPNQILVTDDGYFVHFYSPPDLPPLEKYIVFVLDVSGSMSGHKIDQLRQAMVSILDELSPRDNFTLITFSSGSRVWWPDTENKTYTSWYDRANGPENDADAVVPATADNVARAKNFVRGLYAGGGTAMHDALDTALRVSKAGVSRPDAPLVMVLLTDGLPNGGPEAILQDFTATNAERGAALFTLAFGEDADFGFLRKLALRNGGFGRRIYEAADAHLQLRNFYRQVASPLLSSVNFTYGDGQVEEESLTQTRFSTLFRGSELVVSGRLLPTASLEEPMVVGEGRQLFRSPARLEKASSGERLWAFLTVRQLLDLDAATPNQTLKDRAKDIALKYSFVTPVTSLVVVKPNDTSAVDPERAGGNRGGYYPPAVPFSYASGYIPPAAPGSFGGGYISPGAGGSLGAGYIPPAAPGSFGGAFGAPSGFQQSFFASVPKPLEPSPPFCCSPASGQQQALHISEITWLGGVSNSSHVTLEVNGTAETYELALNKTESQLEECATPGGGPGQCRHLANCVLPNFTDSLDDFLPYLCVVDGSYVGACCPDNTIPATPLG